MKQTPGKTLLLQTSRTALERSEAALREASERLERAKRLFEHLTNGGDAAHAPCIPTGSERALSAERSACAVNVLLNVVYDEEKGHGSER